MSRIDETAFDCFLIKEFEFEFEYAVSKKNKKKTVKHPKLEIK